MLRVWLRHQVKRLITSEANTSLERLICEFVSKKISQNLTLKCHDGSNNSQCYILTSRKNERRIYATIELLKKDFSSRFMSCYFQVGLPYSYSPQITIRSPQEMRVLRQCKFQWAEAMFVTIQRVNNRPSKKEMKKAVTMLPNCPMFSVRMWITASPYLWPIGSFPSTCMLCTLPALH
jgi:hypothetical protein